MKRIATALIVTAAACSLTGCYYVSIHPLVTADVRVYEPRLVGTWIEDGNDEDSLTFAPAHPQYPTHYTVDISAEGRTVRLVGELARIDGQLVLDLTLGDNAGQCPLLTEDGPFMAYAIPGHSFVRIVLEADALRTEMLDSGWLDEGITEKRVTIAHEHLAGDGDPHAPGEKDVHGSGPRDRVVLTASSRDLQALVRTHGKAGLFFTAEPGRFLRRK